MNLNKQKVARVASIIQNAGGIDSVIERCNAPGSSPSKLSRELGISPSALLRLIENEGRGHLILSYYERSKLKAKIAIDKAGGLDRVLERLKTESYYSVGLDCGISATFISTHLERIGAIPPREKYKKATTRGGVIEYRQEKPLITSIKTAQNLRSAPGVDTMDGVDPFIRRIIERGGRLGIS